MSDRNNGWFKLAQTAPLNKTGEWKAPKADWAAPSPAPRMPDMSRKGAERIPATTRADSSLKKEDGGPKPEIAAPMPKAPSMPVPMPGVPEAALPKLEQNAPPPMPVMPLPIPIAPEIYAPAVDTAHDKHVPPIDVTENFTPVIKEVPLPELGQGAPAAMQPIIAGTPAIEAHESYTPMIVAPIAEEPVMPIKETLHAVVEEFLNLPEDRPAAWPEQPMEEQASGYKGASVDGDTHDIAGASPKEASEGAEIEASAQPEGCTGAPAGLGAGSMETTIPPVQFPAWSHPPQTVRRDNAMFMPAVRQGPLIEGAIPENEAQAPEAHPPKDKDGCPPYAAHYIEGRQQ